MHQNKLSIHKLWLVSLLVLLSLCPILINATIYQPGETLEPDCAPAAVNCGVATTTITLSAFDYLSAGRTATTTIRGETNATSTFAGGIEIASGCFSISGVCVGSTSSSDLQHAASYDTNEALTNVPTGGAQTTLGTVSVTPSTVTGDVYVTGFAEVRSNNAADQPFTLSIETTSDCTGTVVGNATVTYTITSGATSNHLGNVRVSGIAVDPGASSQPYSLCAAISSGAGNTDVLNWAIEAIVIDTGADVAEIYSTNDTSVEAGDVISIDTTLNAGVRKSQGAYDQNVLGVVSTRPGTLIGDVDKEGVKAVPVALVGRVPVKVVTENGAIEPGDYLVSSSVPGAAMKIQGRGHVIGQAMSSYHDQGVGLVMMFVKNFYLTPKQVHLEEFCLNNSTGVEVCINGDQINLILQNINLFAR